MHFRQIFLDKTGFWPEKFFSDTSSAFRRLHPLEFCPRTCIYGSYYVKTIDYYPIIHNLFFSEKH